MQKLILTFFFSGLLCVPSVIFAQADSACNKGHNSCGLYEFDIKDSSSYWVTCGRTTGAFWEVKDDSCSLYTAYIPVPGDTGVPITMPVCITLNGSGNLDCTDYALFEYQCASDSTWIRADSVPGCTFTNVHQRGFNVTCSGQDSFRVRVTMVTDHKTKKLQIWSGDICIGVPEESGCPGLDISTAAGCEDTCIQFTSSVPGCDSGNIVLWNWDFGDGTTDTTPNPTHCYLSPGTYTVKLWGEVANCGGNGVVAACDTATTTIHVPLLPPAANFTADTVCKGLCTPFADSSQGNIAAWSWDFGDGDTSTARNPCHLYADSGSYLVTLIVSQDDSGFCADTVQKWVYVAPQIAPPAFTADTVCLGQATSFQSALPPHTGSWEWHFGDTDTSTQLNPVHTFDTCGRFTVKLNVISEYGCADSTVQEVYVKCPPLAAFYYEGDSCRPGTHIKFTDQSSGNISDWHWDFGDGDTSTQQHPAHVYGFDSTMQVTLSVTDSNGCVGAVTQPVNTNSSSVVADFTSSGTCQNSTIAFTDNSAPPGAINDWHWDFGNGDTALQQNPSYSYDSVGTYDVTLIVGDTLGCQDTIVHSVTIFPLPIARFAAPAGCAQHEVAFSDSSYVPGGGQLGAWYWDFGDADTSMQQNPVHYYNDSGTFNVTLQVRDTMGCTDDTTLPVVIHPTPSAGFSAATACQGQPTIFTNTASQADSTLTQWFWDFGDGNTSLEQHPSHTYDTCGSYTVKLTAINTNLIVTDTNLCADTMQQTVKVSCPPVAAFAADTACSYNTTHFTDQSNSNISRWQWDFGNGQISTQQNPTHTFDTCGNIPVALSVTDSSGCADTVVQPVTVKCTPQAAFYFAGDSCKPELTAYFTDQTTGNIMDWHWSFGDGDTSKQQHPTHIYTNDSVYLVKLRVTDDNGCMDSTVRDVRTPLSQVVANFVTGNTCLNDTVQFTNTSAPPGAVEDWHWDFGDDNTSSNEHPNHTYDMLGTYNVMLTAIDTEGCQDTVIQSVTIAPSPIATFSAGAACLGEAIPFNDSSTVASGASWHWEFGDGSSAQQQNPTHTYSDTGTYTPILTVTNNNGCMDADTQTVTVWPIPIPDLTAPPVCLGDSTPFTDLSVAPGAPIDSFWWNFNDMSTSTQQNPVHQYATADTYQVTFMVADTNGCWDYTINPVVVHPLPTADFIADTTCESQTTAFTNQSVINGGGIENWQWNFSNSTTSNQQHPSYTYDTCGIYNVQLAATSVSGCADTTSKPVKVHCPPVADFASDTACLPAGTHFTDESAGNIALWYWDFGDATSSTAPSPTHTYNDCDTYEVMLSVTDSNNCTDVITQPVTVYCSPVASFSSDTVCMNDTLNFTNQSNGNINSLQWLFGDQNSGTTTHPSHVYSACQDYTVQLIVTGSNGCADTAAGNARVVCPVTADFSTSSTICADRPVSFNDQSSGKVTQWFWDFGDGNTSIQEEPAHQYDSCGTYPVQLQVSGTSGCPDTTEQPLRVYCPPQADFVSDSVCLGEPATFQDNSEPGEASMSSYSWSWGDNSSSKGTTASHTYAECGHYTVQLTITDLNGCTDVASGAGTVYCPPEASFVADHTADNAQDHEIRFLDRSSSDVIAWYWDFGTGDTSALQHPTYAFPDKGQYPVTLRVTNQYQCIDTALMIMDFICELDEPEAVLHIPNAFTPNDDGTNDTFGPIFEKRLDACIQDFEMQIWNRWGEMIYRVFDPYKHWNGRRQDNGKLVQNDVYVYIMHITDKTGKLTTLNGYVAKLR